MTGNMRTIGSGVHSHDSSCIYSIENQMGTLSSSPCQLRLGVDLQCISLVCKLMLFGSNPIFVYSGSYSTSLGPLF